jgi:hypothetical protein
VRTVLAFTIGFATLASTVARAHDPGLSALEISVGSGSISVSLSMASADAALAASLRHMGQREAVSALAREAIRLSLDGDTLSPSGDEVSIDDAVARIRTTFEISGDSRGARRLTITSDVPKRLARGHRELLIITAGATKISQTLLNAESDSLAVDLGAGAPRIRLKPDPTPRPDHTSRATWNTAWSFLRLGTQHILSGADHLLFLAGLFLTAFTTRELIVLLTAFTVAHSISLALVVVAGVHLPASVVEPSIAASIAWVGVENLLRARHHRRRWLVVFGFGLMHGFGFAGALTDLGLGTTTMDVAVALFSFNLGVESGQLVVAAGMIGLLWTTRSLPVVRATLRPVCSALVAMAGGYWLFVRLI